MLTSTYFEQEVDKRLGTPNVVFENCLFDGGRIVKGSSGVLAGNDGTVTLLNCTFQNWRFCNRRKNSGYGPLHH